MGKSIFGGVTGVKSSQEANYTRPGRYVAYMDRVKQDETRAHVPFVAFEMTILARLGKEVDEDGKDLPFHNVGDNVSHLIMKGGKGEDMFLPNVKAAVKALMGCAEDEVTEEECVAMVSDDQPLSGMVFTFHARQITTRGGNPFTKVTVQRPMTRSEFAKLEIDEPDGGMYADDVPGYADLVEGGEE